MKIKKISKEQYTGKVYNLHCEPNNNYFANGVLVHNCYKGNFKGSSASNMSLETFKTILNKFPKYNNSLILNQIALGLTSVSSSPDLFPICEYSRSVGVIPNVTINGAEKLSDDQVTKLVSLMGSMAISINETNYENGYELISRLVKAGAKQINIHYVIFKKSLDFAFKVCNDILNNEKLKGLNAIVFLSLKPKNRGQQLEIVEESEFQKLIRFCLNNRISVGCDSCSASKMIRSFNDKERLEFEKFVQKCEACNGSFYCNASGFYFPCSFMEGEDGTDWKDGINLLNVRDFLADVWYHPSTSNFRKLVNSTNNNPQANCCHFKI